MTMTCPSLTCRERNEVFIDTMASMLLTHRWLMQHVSLPRKGRYRFDFTGMATGRGGFGRNYFAGIGDRGSRSAPPRILNRDPIRNDTSGTSGQEDLFTIVQQQQTVTQELQRQNAALLVLTANIDREVKAIRQQASRVKCCPAK